MPDHACHEKDAAPQSASGAQPGARASFPLRAARITSGSLLVLAGAVAVVLPGPFTIPPILAGLQLLSYDVPAAARVRDRLVRSLRRRAGRSAARDTAAHDTAGHDTSEPADP